MLDFFLDCFPFLGDGSVRKSRVALFQAVDWWSWVFSCEASKHPWHLQRSQLATRLLDPTRLNLVSSGYYGRHLHWHVSCLYMFWLSITGIYILPLWTSLSLTIILMLLFFLAFLAFNYTHPKNKSQKKLRVVRFERLENYYIGASGLLFGRTTYRTYLFHNLWWFKDIIGYLPV